MSVEKVEDDGQQRENLYRLLIVVLAGVLIASWVAVVWLVQGKNSAEDDLDKTEKEVESYAAGPDALAAAERILGKMISYDYREIDHEYEWTKYLADESLRSDYDDRLVPKLRKVIKSSQSTAEGTVVEAAYNILDEDQVQVIAFIRQKLTTKADKRGAIDEQWTSLTMILEGGDWLIEKITPLNVPPPS